MPQLTVTKLSDTEFSVDVSKIKPHPDFYRANIDSSATLIITGDIKEGVRIAIHANLQIKGNIGKRVEIQTSNDIAVQGNIGLGSLIKTNAFVSINGVVGQSIIQAKQIIITGNILEETIAKSSSGANKSYIAILEAEEIVVNGGKVSSISGVKLKLKKRSSETEISNEQGQSKKLKSLASSSPPEINLTTTKEPKDNSGKQEENPPPSSLARSPAEIEKNYGKLNPLTASAFFSDEFNFGIALLHKKLSKIIDDLNHGKPPIIEINKKTGPQKIELRDYQIKAMVELCNGWMKGDKNAIYNFPPGAGKTLIFSEIISAFSNTELSILILVPATKLLEQTKEKLRERDAKFSIQVIGKKSQMQEQSKEENSVKITVATYQAFVADYKRQYPDLFPKKKQKKTSQDSVQESSQNKQQTKPVSKKIIPPKFDLKKIGIIILDEIHYAAPQKSNENKRITLALTDLEIQKPTISMLGFSATPGGSYDLLKKSGKFITPSEFPAKKAHELGILAPIIIAHVYCEQSEGVGKLFRKSKEGKEIAEKDLNKELNKEKINRTAVDIYANLSNPITKQRYLGLSALVFCVGIEHAKAVAEQFNACIPLDGHPLLEAARNRFVKKAKKEHLRKHKVYTEKLAALANIRPEKKRTKLENKLKKQYQDYLEDFNEEKTKAKFKIAAALSSELTPKERKAIEKQFQQGGCTKND